MTWDKRYFVREFTAELPAQEIVDRITGIVNYIPSQVSNNDHFWILLTPEHKHIKEWLVDNIHYHQQQQHKLLKENFAHLIDAPYVLHCAYNKIIVDQADKMRYVGRFQGNAALNGQRAFHFQYGNALFGAGALVCEIVHSGLDSTVIACTEGYQTDKEQKRVEYKKLLSDSFPRLQDLNLDPSLSIGFGHGVHHTTTNEVLENEHGHQWYSYKNSHKSPNLVTAQKN